MKQLSPLSGQVAIVTGATKGIGKALVQQLAYLGLRILMVARTQADLDHNQQALLAEFPNLELEVICGSVADWAVVERAVDRAKARWGRVDILINNAGIAGKIALLQEISIEEINQTLDINLKGPIYWMKALIPMMVEQGGGTIINLNSIAGKTAYPYWSLYCASKFGLHAVTQAVKEEQRQNKIKIVGIYPGAVDTPLWQGIEEPSTEIDTSKMLSVHDIVGIIQHVLERPAHVLVEDITLVPQIPAL